MNSALVTGASGELGKAICLQLAKEHGLHIIVNTHQSQQRADAVVNAVEDAGGSAERLMFNVTSAEETDRALTGWMIANPEAEITVLVNCAGIIRDSLFVFTSEENWDSVIDVKLKGFYNVTKPVVQKMLLKRYGRIINVSSVSGLRGQAGQVNYAAANAGLIGATKALALEIAKRNVTVNAVAPGYITSEMTEGLDQEELCKMIPARRFGKPEEVAAVVSFLASKGASYITGEVINISGGIT